MHSLRHTADYAKQYKLLRVGLLKIVELLETNRGVLAAASFQSTDGFPRNETIFTAFAAVVENTCLFGDLVFHIPEMAAKILGGKLEARWRPLIGWSMDFVAQHETILDVDTKEMLSLFDQEINPERRRPDFVNTNRDKRAEEATGTRPKKQRRKLRRGPQLSSQQGAAGGERNEL